MPRRRRRTCPPRCASPVTRPSPRVRWSEIGWSGRSRRSSSRWRSSGGNSRHGSRSAAAIQMIWMRCGKRRIRCVQRRTPRWTTPQRRGHGWRCSRARSGRGTKSGGVTRSVCGKCGRCRLALIGRRCKVRVVRRQCLRRMASMRMEAHKASRSFRLAMPVLLNTSPRRRPHRRGRTASTCTARIRRIT